MSTVSVFPTPQDTCDDIVRSLHGHLSKLNITLHSNNCSHTQHGSAHQGHQNATDNLHLNGVDPLLKKSQDLLTIMELAKGAVEKVTLNITNYIEWEHCIHAFAYLVCKVSEEVIDHLDLNQC